MESIQKKRQQAEMGRSITKGIMNVLNDPDKTSHSFRFDLIEDLRAYRHALEDWALVVFGVVSRPARSPEGRKELLDGMYELTHKAACSLS